MRIAVWLGKQKIARAILVCAALFIAGLVAFFLFGDKLIYGDNAEDKLVAEKTLALLRLAGVAHQVSVVPGRVPECGDAQKCVVILVEANSQMEATHLAISSAVQTISRSPDLAGASLIILFGLRKDGCLAQPTLHNLRLCFELLKVGTYNL